MQMKMSGLPIIGLHKYADAKAIILVKLAGLVTVADDRYYSPTGKTYENIRWSTPSYEYKDYNGIKISSGGEATWSFPEGEYCYARAIIKEIEYNVECQE